MEGFWHPAGKLTMRTGIGNPGWKPWRKERSFAISLAQAIVRKATNCIPRPHGMEELLDPPLDLSTFEKN